MPTYSYECDACGHKLDKFQSINDEPLTKCPDCKKKKLRRLFGTGGGLIFKGSGFYLTDYRSESYKSSAAADKKASDTSSSSDASSKSEAKSDSAAKPAPEKSSSEKSSSEKSSSEKSGAEKPVKSESAAPKKKGKD